MKTFLTSVLSVLFISVYAAALPSMDFSAVSIPSDDDNPYAHSIEALILKDCAGINIEREDLISFYQTVMPLKGKNELLVLVDKKHNIGQYKPKNLVTFSQGFYLTSETAKALKEMIAAARKDGINLYPVSTYRSYKYQQSLFNRRAKQAGLAHAEKYIAKAGASQHQLGTAVDLNSTEESFEKTKQFAWLSKNASKFGFSLSFPKGQENITGYGYEPWHYRYIGKEAVKAQNKFFQGSQQRLLEFLNKCIF